MYRIMLRCDCGFQTKRAFNLQRHVRKIKKPCNKSKNYEKLGNQCTKYRQTKKRRKCSLDEYIKFSDAKRGGPWPTTTSVRKRLGRGTHHWRGGFVSHTTSLFQHSNERSNPSKTVHLVWKSWCGDVKCLDGDFLTKGAVVPSFQQARKYMG